MGLLPSFKFVIYIKSNLQLIRVNIYTTWCKSLIMIIYYSNDYRITDKWSVYALYQGSLSIGDRVTVRKKNYRKPGLCRQATLAYVPQVNHIAGTNVLLGIYGLGMW